MGKTLEQVRDAALAAIYRTRGAPEKRAKIAEIVARISEYRRPIRSKTAEEYFRARMLRCAFGLAEQVRLNFDEHGSTRGDYRRTFGWDYVPPTKARTAPYLDMGGAGLAVISVERKRVYAKSAHCRPSTATDCYLVGRNEAGTFFAHAVPAAYTSVRAALYWIWNGHADAIVRRQGDIAIVRAAGPRMPAKLPAGHRIEGGMLVHATHPPIALPGPGERLIVGRRALTRVGSETRD